jgi:hypothetical protein
MLVFEPEGSMRIDVYTRFVLTVIAVCLVWLSLGGPSLLGKAHAQEKQRAAVTQWDRVVIAGWVDAEGIQHSFRANAFEGVPVAVVSGAR